MFANVNNLNVGMTPPSLAAVSLLPVNLTPMNPNAAAASSGDLFGLISSIITVLGIMPGVQLPTASPLVNNSGIAGGAQLPPQGGPVLSPALPVAPPIRQQVAAPGNRPPRIAQIDDFSTDNTGFNHGAEVAKTLNPDGSIDLLQLNIGGGGDHLAKISNSLDNVIARVQKGETIDAVNLSQQDFGDSPQTAEIRAKIDQLTTLGVPVAVAAGNNGPGQQNSLVSERAFSVESTTNGQVNSDSGLGNVMAEGRTTSFATANFAHKIALQHAAGLDITA